MALNTVPPSSELVDGQYIQVSGPNGLISGFLFDQQTKTLYSKESQVLFPSMHGASHISQDPVPESTCDTRGLMSAADKCKLDSLVGTRLGVLGFMGAGFPDDGGWMQGDIILAAGTEFISLERVGNVVRFTVDSPVPLNCSCETCAQIFWVQDETDVNAIRPPTCGGKMPGVNGYGELKIYAFPESAVFDPNNPSAKLNNKGQYPSLIFKRYENSITPGMAEFDCVLKRDSLNFMQTEIGWSMTPGAANVPEMVWFMGKDANGSQMRFELLAETAPGLLGGLLFNGNLISKRPAVIVNYTAGVISTNQYVCKWWDVEKRAVIGDSFVATNVWMYNYPENSATAINPQRQVLDVAIDILPVGTVVDATYVQVGEVAGTPILHYYFNKRPEANPANMWAQVGSTQFGDLLTSREESTPTGGLDDRSGSISVDASRTLERSVWGLTGVDDPLVLYNDYSISGPNTPRLNNEPRAIVDGTLPGLVIQQPPTDIAGHFCERPVFLWNRNEIDNALVKLEIGRPTYGSFRPLDVLLSAPIDSYDDQYMRVVQTGASQGRNFIRVKGVRFNDIPQAGAVRVISPGNAYNVVFRYGRKMLWTNSPDDDLDSLVLVADASNNAYAGSLFDMVQLVHADYDAPCVRLELVSNNDSQESVSLQVKVGRLSMGTAYENDIGGGTIGVDDYIRGLAGGYSISQVYTQSAKFTGVGTAPTSVPQGFRVYEGGVQAGGDQLEYWNTVEILYRSGQVWLWWNGLLITPSTQLSATLPTPVGVSTPYFPLATTRRSGKVGLRMWPGMKLRSIGVRAQLRSMSEFGYGQVSLA